MEVVRTYKYLVLHLDDKLMRQRSFNICRKLLLKVYQLAIVSILFIVVLPAGDTASERDMPSDRTG